MTKLVGTILKLMNIFVVMAYLSACLIPLLPAGKFWMFAVLGLVFPVLFVIVAVFFMGWLLARSGWCLLSLIALLLSWQQIGVMAGLNAKKEFTIAKDKSTLRILSWNLSSWGENSQSYMGNKEIKSLMTKTILSQNADVLCFQEFVDHDYNFSYPPSTKVYKELGYPYSYYAETTIGNVRFEIGVVILSKYPILDTARFSYGDDDFAEDLIYADIQFHHQKVRVFTTHLQSVRFEDEEYIALRKIKQQDESGLKDSKTIVRKLKNAYWYRGNQADFVQQKIKESPYPVIISGDFNDVPNSYTYFTTRGNLQDAFVKKGYGLGRTFRYLSPTLRIDYIFGDKMFKVEQYTRMRVPYSDHYPIVADFHIP